MGTLCSVNGSVTRTARSHSRRSECGGGGGGGRTIASCGTAAKQFSRRTFCQIAVVPNFRGQRQAVRFDALLTECEQRGKLYFHTDVRFQLLRTETLKHCNAPSVPFFSCPFQRRQAVSRP
jgi:hypothetical protein